MEELTCIVVAREIPLVKAVPLLEVVTDVPTAPRVPREPREPGVYVREDVDSLIRRILAQGHSAQVSQGILNMMFDRNFGPEAIERVISATSAREIQAAPSPTSPRALLIQRDRLLQAPSPECEIRFEHLPMGTRIRHSNGKGHYAYGRVSSSRLAINPSQFAAKHYKDTRPERKPSNAWSECQFLRGDEWLALDVIRTEQNLPRRSRVTPP